MTNPVTEAAKRVLQAIVIDETVTIANPDVMQLMHAIDAEELAGSTALPDGDTAPAHNRVAQGEGTGYAGPMNRGPLRTRDEMRGLLVEAVREAGSQKIYAAQLGMSRHHLNDILMGRRPVGEGLCRALGFRRAELYEPIDEAD